MTTGGGLDGQDLARKSLDDQDQKEGGLDGGDQKDGARTRRSDGQDLQEEVLTVGSTKGRSERLRSPKGRSLQSDLTKGKV